MIFLQPRLVQLRQRDERNIVRGMNAIGFAFSSFISLTLLFYKLCNRAKVENLVFALFCNCFVALISNKHFTKIVLKCL